MMNQVAKGRVEKPELLHLVAQRAGQDQPP